MIASAETRAAVDVAAAAAMVWAEHKNGCPACQLAARRRTGKCGRGAELFGELAAADAAVGVARELDEQPHPDQETLWP